MSSRNILIGVAGGSASGKSRLSRDLCNSFSDHSILITQDNYYHDSSALSEAEKSEKNYDHPQAIELERLYEDLIRLKDGSFINSPVYCFETHSRLADTRLIQPAQIVIVEGLFIFEHLGIRDLLDLKVFLSVASDIRVLRRIERDVSARGRALDSVISQYLDTVRPMHEEFVEPAKAHADIIFPSTDDKDIDYAVIKIKEMTKNILANAEK